ncbi:hypothetical protein RHMOL_Rhmol06G0055200 [Rhododendron molle]|uniref:Uncharacterized protein n=1 Tax=Rhododendron molle TaxID=49168 RepID=A0ACC0NB11_RHOML|nr:hypothetical protein RHMOL_Rhmol06G0055200 [Rhododendron molle]
MARKWRIVLPPVSSGIAPSCIQNSRTVSNDDNRDRGSQSDAALKAAERGAEMVEDAIFESSSRQKLTTERTDLTTDY